jgi:predicted RNase H-like HicB family nuclease
MESKEYARMRCYIALLTKDGPNRYRIELPDFPGSANWGESLEEARRLAERMVAEEIDLRTAAGEPIPRPTAPEWLMDRAARAGAVAIVVPAPQPITERVSVHVDLPAGLVDRVDERARVHGVNRSDLLEKAARLALWETSRAERSLR